MILDMKPVSLAEVKEIIKNMDEKKSLEDYLKKFNKLSNEKADKLKESVKGLDNPKIREDDFIKLADFVPKTSEDINKIFNDVSLNEEEINALLEILKEY
ncbi:hypothetical protein COU60_01055 [Candidatus Pacearchaeota archaeon CG10_big_fil_rev_8_21_14_0_10_34_76]|nr:MAG: hypothetical protein COU60_01055 [Candidatus Pacearchaeota archaeon CG10_big_fil_rev_8_21_14_0_10_34_76]